MSEAATSNLQWQSEFSSKAFPFLRKSNFSESRDPHSILIHKALNGSLDAFNELVLEFQEMVYRQACWVLGDEKAAEDATQEVFLRAYANLKSFRDGPFKPWILKITTNYCLDQLRRMKHRTTLPLDVLNDYGEEIESSSWLIDKGMRPEEIIEHNQMENLLIKCINHLSPEYRLVVILIDVQEMDYQDTAEVLGIPLGTMKSRLSRARMQLRGLLQMHNLYSSDFAPMPV